MKLTTISEAGFSRRAFLKGAGKAAGALTISNPLELAKQLTKVPSADFDVLAYGAQLFNGLSQQQKQDLDSFMFWAVNSFDSGNVRSFRNVDLRKPVKRFEGNRADPLHNHLGHDLARTDKGSGYVVKDGIVYFAEGDDLDKNFNPFPIDAIFGQYTNTIDANDARDFFETFLSGDDTAQFMDKILPGSVSSILNKFVDQIGYDGISNTIRNVAENAGVEPGFMWYDLIKVDEKLRSMLGITNAHSPSELLKAFRTLTDKGLLTTSEASVVAKSLNFSSMVHPEKKMRDFEREHAETNSNINHNKEIKKQYEEKRLEDKKLEKQKQDRDNDRKLASSMHQSFESRLKKALLLI